MAPREVVKVTRNYQVTIPASIRVRAGIREGDLLRVIYDEEEKAVKLIPLSRGRRTIRVGRKISVEEMEEAVEEMMSEATS